jgi:iron-sulfur cluster assembly protein CyaY
MIEEQAYRALVDRTFATIDEAFGEVDPDLAESSLSQGALTITFRGKERAILSPQPAVRQVWMAFRDHAWHFDWNGSRWMDDRGKGLDLHAVVKDTAREAGGVEVELP